VAPYHPILFDLDGTVADTHPGILEAAQATLAGLGLPPIAPGALRALTGRGIEPLAAGLLRASGVEPGPDAVQRVAEVYAGQYAQTCVRGAQTYPGMRELLQSLPRPLGLLTNKARRFTEPILRELGLAASFDVVVCGDDPGARLKPDPWAIEEALRRTGGGRKPILVGDAGSDWEAARAARIECCLVGWGNGEGVASAILFAATPAELAALLENGA
jgi:phosphoglycolate phosphatase